MKRYFTSYMYFYKLLLILIRNTYFYSDVSQHHAKDAVASTLIGRKWLCNESGHRSILVRLKIENGEKYRYEPGDHAAVFPVNSGEDVDIVMKHVSGLPKDTNAPVQLQEYQPDSGIKTNL